MDKLKKLLKNRWFRTLTFVCGGALLGFGYYYFVGCTTGSCPLTSNPYISTGYGSVIGLLLSGGT